MLDIKLRNAAGKNFVKFYVAPPMPPVNTPTCWIITEGLTGTENQCLGVAESLDLTPEVKRIHLRQPWKALSPFLGFEKDWTFIPALLPPWPDLLIASGRKSIAAARYIKRLSGEKTFTVQIQDPRISPHHFDLVALPRHDKTRGTNVMVTTAAPNRITQKALAEAKTQYPHFAALPSPRLAVLIGGHSKAYRMTASSIRTIAQQLQNLNAGLMITASRRTGEENTRILKDALHTKPHIFWDGRPPNPYLAMLGWADYILVTADSTSMLSEAASTGKPTYMMPLPGGTPRIRAMQKNLMDSGCIKLFEGQLDTWSPKPLTDAAAIAAEIRKRMALSP